MKLAIAQLITSENKNENLIKAQIYIKKAKQAGADIVVLPETYMALMPASSQRTYAEVAESLDDAFVQTLAAQAKKYAIHVVCGIYESKPGEKKRAYNTVVMLDDEGKLIHSYRKTHLYDAFSYQESKGIIAGDNEFIPVKTKLGTIGLLVCYELRFPEISRTLALKGAELLLAPTAWVAGPMKEEHFLSLSKARALENTLFLGAASQTGNIYVGRSIIYNPMGVAIASSGEDEGLIIADIDLSQVDTIRNKLPCLSQRRPALYTLI